jgi:aryl-alcohol dehydrogenase-like predicted oxidoreductase
MKQNIFGTTELTVSTLGLGCSCLGGNLHKGNYRDGVATLQAALDAGVNFYDTASSYGQGQSELLLGKAFKQHRDQVILATKAGYCLSSARSLLAKAKPILKPLVSRFKSTSGSSIAKARSSLQRQDFTVDYLTQSIEGSLKRLQTDYLDLFMDGL